MKIKKTIYDKKNQKKVQLLEISNGKLAKTAENNVNKMKKPSPIMNNFKNYIDELKCKNNELKNNIEIKEKRSSKFEKK